METRAGTPTTDQQKNKGKRKKMKQMEDDEGVLPSKDMTGSRISVKTLDIYDPYDYREGMGHLSNLQAWLHVVKCSFGTGVLTMPMGFRHAGMVPGIIFGFVIGGFCLYCMQLLIKNMVHISARERKAYIPFNQTMTYTFAHGYPLCRKLAGSMKTFTDVILAGYHFGICITYTNYMAQTSLSILRRSEKAEGYNVDTIAATFFWVVPLYAICTIRNLKYLAPVSFVGNVLTAASMGIIIYYIFQPTEHGFVSDDWELFGSFKTMPIYIGIILFAVEAFGVIIAVERDMKEPRDFVGFFGVFDQAMFLVLAWYLFLGSAGYLRYGSQVRSSISFTIPLDAWPSIVMYISLCLALLCSFPLHFYVCIDIVWTNNIMPKLSNRQLFWEYVFRFGCIIIAALGAILIPQLDLLVSLIGSVCLSFLGIIMPAVMDYNVSWSKYGMQWNFHMVKAIIIIVIGVCAFFVGTYGCVYWLFESPPDAHLVSTTTAGEEEPM